MYLYTSLIDGAVFVVSRVREGQEKEGTGGGGVVGCQRDRGGGGKWKRGRQQNKVVGREPDSYG